MPISIIVMISSSVSISISISISIHISIRISIIIIISSSSSTISSSSSSSSSGGGGGGGGSSSSSSSIIIISNYYHATSDFAAAVFYCLVRSVVLNVSCTENPGLLHLGLPPAEHFVCFLTRRSLFDSDGMPRVVLWRPEALDCRLLIPQEACNGPTPNPPSLGFEPETSCIRADPSAERAIGATTASFQKLNFEKWAQALGDLNVQRAIRG